MLYLGIDQHARQFTVSLRDENGDVIKARQVSTKPEKIHDFFQRLTAERLKAGEKFVAVLEVCGFNEWLIRMLRDYRCHKAARGPGRLSLRFAPAGGYNLAGNVAGARLHYAGSR